MFKTLNAIKVCLFTPLGDRSFKQKLPQLGKFGSKQYILKKTKRS